MAVQQICVFCGSSSGNSPVYVEAAKQLGLAFVEKGVELIYGGGRLGLMGTIADTMIENGGKATGVIPRYLVEREVAHTGLSDLIVVESMHARKAKMAELSDGFIAMAGGFGTFEEFIEIITWSMLGFHAKPCALLNTAGYYDHMLAMFTHATDEGFLAERHRDMVLVDADPVSLMARMLSYTHSTAPKFTDSQAKLT